MLVEMKLEDIPGATYWLQDGKVFAWVEGKQPTDVTPPDMIPRQIHQRWGDMWCIGERLEPLATHTT
jgi:hypothetical protein